MIFISLGEQLNACRNEVLMRSANLLNDFAFKYVFGKDCKEANDALKSLLTVFLERKVVNVHVTNMGVDPLLETIVEFDDNTKMKLAIFINQNRLKLQYLSEFYLMKLYGSQEESDLKLLRFMMVWKVNLKLIINLEMMMGFYYYRMAC